MWTKVLIFQGANPIFDVGSLSNIFGFSRYDIAYGENRTIDSCTFYDAGKKTLTDVQGQVRMINLDLHDKDSIEYNSFRYNPQTGEWEQGVTAHRVYKVCRIAFESAEGDYDLMLQPYIPLSPENQIAEYLSEIQKKYRLIVGEEPMDLHGYGEEGEIFADILEEYTKVVQEADAEKLMNTLMLDTLSESIQLLSDQLKIEITEEELLTFYMDFYQAELDDFYGELFQDYGDFEISYEAMDLQHYPKDMIEKANALYKVYGLSTIEIEDIAEMNVRFVVASRDGEEVVTDGFLFPTVQLMKMHGIWKMVMPNGFPRPSNGDVWEFLAPYQTREGERT